MSNNFIPPNLHLPTMWLADAVTPTLLKVAYNIEDVKIEPADRKMLRTLRDRRLIYFSNHPTQSEPPVAWTIANAMGARFYSMATRRAFDFGFGLVGKVFQATGGFSVIPGIADRESMSMARKVLTEPAGKLSLYPEGEPMSSENDNLMPFQAGIVKLGLSAMDDARKIDPEADITILPAFIKYVIKSPQDVIKADLEKSISRIENKLGVNPGERNLLRRFLMVGRVITEQAEAQYNLPVSGDMDWDFRVGRLRHAMLDGIAGLLQLARYDKSADAIMKLRFLTAVVELKELNHPQCPVPETVSKADLALANQEVIPAVVLIVMRREYLVAYPSAERFYEWLARFESLVLGKTPRMLGGEPSHLPRTAFVNFAQPFGLSEYYEEYKRDRKVTLQVILDRLYADMKRMLDANLTRSRPLVEPYDVGET